MGENKGQIGTIQSKDKKKGNLIVFIDETYEIIEYKLNEVCEYINL